MEQTLIDSIVTKKPQYSQDSPLSFKFEALSSPLASAREKKFFFECRFFDFFSILDANQLPDPAADSRIGLLDG